jgi:hypothetical protein
MVYATQTVMDIIVVVNRVIGARQIAMNHTWGTSVQKFLLHPPQRRQMDQQRRRQCLGHLKEYWVAGMLSTLVYTRSSW